jgi:large subunit ribosomal protein L18
MNPQKAKAKRQLRRRRHVRRKITGTPERPRLSVFRSSKHIGAQLIDDLSGRTLAAVSSLSPAVREQVKYGGNVAAAKVVGQRLAEVAREKGIQQAAFDRGHYKYHGRVKALAEAATQGGLVCCTLSEEAPKAKKGGGEKKKEAPPAKKGGGGKKA